MASSGCTLGQAFPSANERMENQFLQEKLMPGNSQSQALWLGRKSDIYEFHDVGDIISIGRPASHMFSSFLEYWRSHKEHHNATVCVLDCLTTGRMKMYGQFNSFMFIVEQKYPIIKHSGSCLSKPMLSSFFTTCVYTSKFKIYV